MAGLPAIARWRQGLALGTAGLLATLTVVGVHLPAAGADPPGGIAQRIADPAYIHPVADPAAWDRLIGSNPGSVGIVVANVNNGPDYQPAPAWAAVIRRAHKAGIKVLGYVDSGYLGATGLRTRLGSTSRGDWISQMERDVNGWYDFYGASIDGIFFDDGENQCGPVAGSTDWADTYAGMTSFVKTSHPGALTVINPGTAVPRCYESSADVLLTFEGSYLAYAGHPATPAEAYVPLNWDPVDPQKIWHLVYGAATQAEMDGAIALSKGRHAGYVYVTDGTLANPWDSVPGPAYWADEQNQVRSSGWNSASPPPPPAGMALGAVSSTAVQLIWMSSTASSPPVTAYEIFRDGVWTSSVNAGITAFLATGLDPSTAYAFAVRSRDAADHESELGATVTATTAPAPPSRPSAPDGLRTAKTEYTSTTLSWSPSVAGAAPVVGYRIYQDEAKIMSVPADTTSVTIGGLTPGTSSVTFTVAAFDALGAASSQSSPVTATTLSLPGGQSIGSPQASELFGTFTYRANFYVPFGFRRVFIETSAQPQACWRTSSAPAICAGYLIENSRLFKYAGTGRDWSWAIVAGAAPRVDGYTYAWSIPGSAIGFPSMTTVVYQGDGYAPAQYSPIVSAAVPLLDFWCIFPETSFLKHLPSMDLLSCRA